MPVATRLGHVIRFNSDEELHAKTQDLTCIKCNLKPTPEGSDPCLGNLPGVLYACCGHGKPGRAYILFENGIHIQGFDTVRNIGQKEVDFVKEHRGRIMESYGKHG